MDELWLDRTRDILADWIPEKPGAYAGREIRAVADWLRNKASVDDWHRAALNLNWDHGLEPLFWIARQARCDKATALMIFYYARPGQLLGFGGDAANIPGWQKDAFYLTAEIRERFLAGFYTRSEIAFDGDQAFGFEAYLPKNPPLHEVDEVIPPVMRRSIPGRILAEGYDVKPELWTP
jgi:hypothetical protein